MNCCKKCIHWQGKPKEVLYADCFMVIGYLVPNFLNCYSDLGYKLTLPFDPHDKKYYTNSIQFQKLYHKIFKLYINDAIRKDIVIKDDLIFDSYGRIKISKVKLLYFRTHKGYCCNYFENKEIKNE